MKAWQGHVDRIGRVRPRCTFVLTPAADGAHDDGIISAAMAAQFQARRRRRFDPVLPYLIVLAIAAVAVLFWSVKPENQVLPITPACEERDRGLIMLLLPGDSPWVCDGHSWVRPH